MNDQQPKTGMGCFAKGCLALIIVVLFLIVVGGGGGWWIYAKAVNSFTSDHSANVGIDQPSPVAFQQAEAKIEQLRNAVRNKTGATIEFSAADLNALIARDPGFVGMRGKMRVSAAGNDIILDLSAPLDTVPLPKFKDRWFNGRAQFGFAYDLGQFSFMAHSIEANGHRIASSGTSGFSSSFLQSFSSSYTRSFNQSFHKAQEKNQQGLDFWKQIKGMSIENGQLVVVTQAGG